MSVLNVARETGGGSVTAERTPESDTNGHSSSEAERIDLAERLSVFIEDFASGFIPLHSNVSIEWGKLSPIFSVLGSAATVLTFLVGWF